MKAENIYKLATKEDPHHIHKTLGALSFTNFVYRYFSLLSYGTMNLESNYPVSMAFLGIHALLSLTSLQFHISRVRNPSLPMIYPEFRMHSILFAMRSIICCYMAMHHVPMMYKIAVCFATMILADLATYLYKTKASTTMRGMPFDRSITAKQQHDITRGQSAMQIGATLFMLGNADTAFTPLFAIQIAAFLMTLVRKNIIDANMWHLIYNLSLYINVFCYKTVPVQWMTTQIVLFYLFKQMRFSWNMNKYAAWSVVFFFFYMHETYEIISPSDMLIKYLDVEFIYKNTIITWVYMREIPTIYGLLLPLGVLSHKYIGKTCEQIDKGVMCFAASFTGLHKDCLFDYEMIEKHTMQLNNENEQEKNKG